MAVHPDYYMNFRSNFETDLDNLTEDHKNGDCPENCCLCAEENLQRDLYEIKGRKRPCRKCIEAQDMKEWEQEHEWHNGGNFVWDCPFCEDERRNESSRESHKQINTVLNTLDAAKRILDDFERAFAVVVGKK